MGIEWFDDESKQSNDLPWVKEYIATGGSGDIPADVWHVYECPSGLLVLTEYWKGFVYSRAKVHTQLSEALTAYISCSDLLPRLVTCATESGKLSFGLDRDRVDAAWVKRTREYSQMFGEDGDFPSDVAKRLPRNPLLPPIPTGSTNTNNSKVEPKRKQAKSAA